MQGRCACNNSSGTIPPGNSFSHLFRSWHYLSDITVDFWKYVNALRYPFQNTLLLNPLQCLANPIK